MHAAFAEPLRVQAYGRQFGVDGGGEGEVVEAGDREVVGDAQAEATQGIDYVEFSIDGAEPHIISPDSSLPDITDQLVIDAEPGTIVVDGTNAGDGTAVGSVPVVEPDANDSYSYSITGGLRVEF